MKSDLKQIKTVTVSSASTIIRNQFLKGKPILGILCYSTSLQNNNRGEFHSSLVVITHAKPRQLFIIDPQLPASQSLHKKIYELKKKLQLSNKTPVNIAYGDECDNFDCFYKTLEFCSLILGGLDLRHFRFQQIIMKCPPKMYK